MNSPARLSRRAEFYDQLASCLEAGVTLVEGLRMATRRSQPRTAGLDIPEIRAALEQGRTLGEATRHWSAFDHALLEAGENSGRLDHTLRLLAVHYRDQAALMRMLIAGLAYPALIAVLAIGIFPISLFVNLVTKGEVLPFLLQKALVLGPVTAGVIALAWVMQTERADTLRAVVERALTFVPGLGSARRNLALARLASVLHAMVSSGVLLIPAWEMAGDACGSPRFRSTVRGWRHRLENGATPAEMLQENDVFPEMFTNLYASGEVSGKLDDALARLQRHYQEEGSRGLKTFNAVLIMGVYLSIILAIAWQVISFWLGYFQQINDVMN